MSSNEEHFRKLERMYVRAAINRYYEPRIEISEGRANITIQIRPDFFHAAGAIHGSVYFKVLDDAAFFAANSTVDDVFVLTVSFTTYFTRPVSQGELRATGTVVHRSRNLVIAEAIAYNGDTREVARGNGTFMRSQVALSSEIGYD